ncbi:MAG: acyl-CoA dehydrogenase family protein [Deltaproteobacteria bacterium]|nr:acyl-CoA dehydrogenase family protein [Deltaproteobacteria bacterium]MBW1950257.1 acyl-CoA dehydrogenase family protein [Deltaproteobacteria bacterium]
MDFELTEENRIFRDAIRDFAEKEIAPLVDEAEETGIFPKQLFRKMGEQGFLCPRYPIELGGGGGDKVTECIMVEEINRVCPGIAAALMAQSGLATQPLYHFGSDELKEKFLIPAIRGEKIGAFGLTEPDVGSDAASIRTRAVRDEDHYVINGTKMFITNGPICDYVVVAAYTDPTKRGEGINLFVVERGTPGFSVSRKLDKLGNRSAETGELVFEDCRVPARNMIGGKEGGGFGQLADTLVSGRITYGARCTGTAQAAYDLTVRYAKERVQFGKPIVKFQNTRFKLAEIATQVDVMRTYTYRVAHLYDQGKNVRKEAAMVKLFTAEILQKILGLCMQIHGGYGYMMEYPIQRFWRDGRLYTVTEGTSEIQRMIIAKELGL